MDSSLNTDTHTIPGMPFNNPNRVTRFAEKVTYGQEAVLTTIRLAALYNHALSGKCYQPFDVAEVRTPDNSIIYHASPQETEELHMDIDMTNDIVVEGLQQTFSYYTACYPNSFSDYSYQFIHSGRLLAKSGTADMSPNPDNHTMAVTLLDESRQNIICTGVIAVNYLESDKNYLTTEAAMAERLLAVFDSLGVIPHE